MSDMIAAGATWLAGKLKSYVSENVTYFRGTQSVVIQATFASQILRVTDRLGNTKVERADADFIFTAADLNFGAGSVEPQAGDMVQVQLPGWTVTKKFQVMPIGPEPAWRYEDPFQTMARVRTKYVGNA